MTAIAGTSSTVNGQSYEYRVVRLEPEFANTVLHDGVVETPLSIDEQEATGLFFNSDSSVALGINENGAVVGSAYVSTNTGLPTIKALRAFVWQPFPTIPGVGTETLHHIPMWSASDFTYSIATAINDDGDVCGYAVDQLQLSNTSGSGIFDRAFITPLRPGLGSLATNVMHELSSNGDNQSAAHDLTDRGAGVVAVVGRGGDPASPCGAFANNAVRWTPDSSLASAVLDTDNYAGTADQSSGWGINPSSLTPGMSEYIAGFSGTCNAQQTACDGFTDFLPSSWVDTELYGAGLFASPDLWEEGQSRDANDFGVLTGYARILESGSPSVCIERATQWIWDPVNLGFDLTILAPSPVDDDNDTTGTALNQHGVIVGYDQPTLAALRWDMAGATDLNTLVALPNSGITAVEVATDINDAGWITASGTLAADGTTTVGVVLVPIGDCPEDVDLDGDVDADDLAIVQAAASAGTTCNNVRRIAWEDVNGDCLVNQADIKLILKAMTRATCNQTTLNGMLAETWLSAGGAALLDSDPDASGAVEAAYAGAGEVDTFVNLMILLGVPE